MLIEQGQHPEQENAIDVQVSKIHVWEAIGRKTEGGKRDAFELVQVQGSWRQVQIEATSKFSSYWPIRSRCWITVTVPVR
jgi:hypothetical protein